MIVASCTSGFAGVYLERIFKEPELSQRSPEAAEESKELLQVAAEQSLKTDIPATPEPRPEVPHMAASNLRLGVFGTLFAFPAALTDFVPNPSRYTVGWTLLAWFIVCNGAIGGILVAVTIKYLDNIARSFCSAFSVMLAGLLDPDGGPEAASGTSWRVGAGLIVASVVLYQNT